MVVLDDSEKHTSLLHSCIGQYLTQEKCKFKNVIFFKSFFINFFKIISSSIYILNFQRPRDGIHQTFKTRPKQRLGYFPLDIALPVLAYWILFKLQSVVSMAPVALLRQDNTDQMIITTYFKLGRFKFKKLT